MKSSLYFGDTTSESWVKLISSLSSDAAGAESNVWVGLMD